MVQIRVIHISEFCSFNLKKIETVKRFCCKIQQTRLEKALKFHKNHVTWCGAVIPLLSFFLKIHGLLNFVLPSLKGSFEGLRVLRYNGLWLKSSLVACSWSMKVWNWGIFPFWARLALVNWPQFEIFPCCFVSFNW